MTRLFRQIYRVESRRAVFDPVLLSSKFRRDILHCIEWSNRTLEESGFYIFSNYERGRIFYGGEISLEDDVIALFHVHPGVYGFCDDKYYPLEPSLTDVYYCVKCNVQILGIGAYYSTLRETVPIVAWYLVDSSSKIDREGDDPYTVEMQYKYHALLSGFIVSLKDLDVVPINLYCEKSRSLACSYISYCNYVPL